MIQNSSAWEIVSFPSFIQVVTHMLQPDVQSSVQMLKYCIIIIIIAYILIYINEQLKEAELPWSSLGSCYSPMQYNCGTCRLHTLFPASFPLAGVCMIPASQAAVLALEVVHQVQYGSRKEAWLPGDTQNIAVPLSVFRYLCESETQFYPFTSLFSSVSGKCSKQALPLNLWLWFMVPPCILLAHRVFSVVTLLMFYAHFSFHHYYLSVANKSYEDRNPSCHFLFSDLTVSGQYFLNLIA